MNKIIAAKTHTLLSLPNEELVALSNVLNEVLNNSNITDDDCETRIGVDLSALRRLHGEIGAILEYSGRDPFEIFDAEKQGFSLQLRAISALGCPADLGYEEVLKKIGDLDDHAS